MRVPVLGAPNYSLLEELLLFLLAFRTLLFIPRIVVLFIDFGDIDI